MSKRKNPSGANNQNADFCDFLIELSEYEKNVTRNIHKFNAYRKAAGVLAAYHKRIESGDEAKKLEGIGEKISKKIDEFLQTGKLRKLEDIHQDGQAKAINLLTRVSGIGPVKAAELVKSGITSIDGLRLHLDKLNHHQIIGLKYFEDFEKKIPRSEIQEIERKLREIILDLDTEFTVTICGSYRRGKAESGDIDVLVTRPSLKVSEGKKKRGETLLKSIVEQLKESLVTDVISIGDTKFMGVCRLSSEFPYRRLDIRLIPCEQYHCAVLYFTGSDVFNKTMRAHALEQGFTLNEYSLRPVGVTGVPGEMIPIASEQEIFEYINYPYKNPEERNM
ncbi:DNA polymerase beta-like isoform X2 [Amyelois transitella]|nr:DNA polymerase beta-like isoform X2 [Amyelois transitella]XP_060803810.1 DNA polymerase beta-like isoform X2 [Amyelois transitella]XP_060803811.1 DNA polymerase beta-like isoform X2 [Amyelois transitella]XP_060803812.1 DNA polymerase beta-like isoform X2 [Amyelois transitella]XP_060803813.1 DNA polymerase beta-like isoform X2 [Amyelois transitella]XP_060803814.1 DNA polymerase beta-like isoform X2 [Amyelois transitella]